MTKIPIEVRASEWADTEERCCRCGHEGERHINISVYNKTFPCMIPSCGCRAYDVAMGGSEND